MVQISGSDPANYKDYSIFIIPPSDIPKGLVVMDIPAAGGVFIRITNVTGDDISVLNSEFVIDIWRHGNI